MFVQNVSPRSPCCLNTISLSRLLRFRLLLHDFSLSSLTPPSCSPLSQTRSVMGPCGMQFPSSQLQSLLRKGTMWWSQLTCPPQSLFWSGDVRGNVLAKYEKSERGENGCYVPGPLTVLMEKLCESVFIWESLCYIFIEFKSVNVSKIGQI